MTNSSSIRFQPYAFILLILGHIILLINLFGVRVDRLRFIENSVFFTGQFIALLALTLVLTIGTTWLWRRGTLPRWVRELPIWIPIIAIALSFILLTAIPRFIPNFEIYLPPFAFWLLVFDLAVLLLLIERLGQHIDWTSILRRVAVLAVAILVPILLLEAGLRLWFTFFGSETDRISYVYSVEEIFGKGTTRVAGYPYINFGLATNHFDHNSRGYRGEELQDPKRNDTFRIFALGGSTTYGVGVDAETSYPAQLERQLRKQGYQHVEVVNAGVMAYTTYDTLANFIYHVLDDDPDMILVYHGVNDVIARLVDPDHYTALNGIRGLWAPNSQALPSSTLLRFIGINLGLISNPNSIEWAMPLSSGAIRCNTEQDYCDELNMEASRVLSLNPPTYFEQNLRHLIVLAQANGVDVVLSNWAYFPEPSNGNITMTRPHMQDGVQEHNKIVAELAEEFDLAHYDLFANLPLDATYWIDGIHLNGVGTFEQAQLYADFLIENDLIPPLPSE